MCIKVIEKHGLAMIFCWRVWKRNGKKVSGWCEPTPHLVGQTLRWFRIGKISSCFLLFAHLSTTQAWIFSNKKNISSPPVTWRIIPRSKSLGSPQFTSHLDHLEGEQPGSLRDLRWPCLYTMAQVLGMILQSTTLTTNLLLNLNHRSSSCLLDYLKYNIQGGPLAVINGVITPINGLING